MERAHNNYCMYPKRNPLALLTKYWHNWLDAYWLSRRPEQYLTLRWQSRARSGASLSLSLAPAGYYLHLSTSKKSRQQPPCIKLIKSPVTNNWLRLLILNTSVYLLTQFAGPPMTLPMTPTRVMQISAIWLVMQHRENFYNFTSSRRPNRSSRNSLHPHRRSKDVPPLPKDGSTAATTWTDQCQLQLALHGAKPFHCQWGSSS